MINKTQFIIYSWTRLYQQSICKYISHHFKILPQVSIENVPRKKPRGAEENIFSCRGKYFFVRTPCFLHPHRLFSSSARHLKDVMIFHIFSHGAKLRKRIHTHKEKGEYLQKCGFRVPKNQKTLSPVTQKRQKDAPETSVNKPKVPENLRPFFRKISFSASYRPKLRRHNMR